MEARIQHFARLAVGRDVLDCGAAEAVTGKPGVCGGRDVWLHAVIAGHSRSCLGIDLDADLVRKINEDGKYRFVAGNIEQMAFAAQFDLVTAGDVIEHLDNPGAFLSRVHSALRPGGRLALTTPNAFGATYVAKAALLGREVIEPGHTCWYSPQTLTQLLNRHGFDVDRLVLLSRPARYAPVEKVRSWLARLQPMLADQIFVDCVRRD